MAINVKAYTRHRNGKLVTVSGYAADRKALFPHAAQAGHAPVHRENVARSFPQNESVPGTYVQGSVTRGLGGLTAYLYKPGAPDRDIPTYRWRQTILPIRGAYKIPKNESGNLYDYGA